jgi:hypothetical protein
VYRRHLIHVENDFPLFGCSYFGQAVRSTDRYANQFEVAKTRWNEENNQATRESRDLGLLAALDMFGETAFDDSIVDFRIGPLSEVQAWADALEKKLIDDNGGVLRNMDKRLKQTLNITKGGKGAKWWKSKIAFRNKKLNEFKKELNEFVEEKRPSILNPSVMENTSRVPFNYVNPKTGYKLGSQLRKFRERRMLMGHPDKDEIRAWAESLPKWVWKIDQSTDEELKAVQSASKKALWANQTPEAYEARVSKFRKTVNTPEAKVAQSASKKAMWANATPEVKAAWSAKSKKTRNTPESKAAAKVRGKAQHANETPEAKTDRLAKKAATWATKRELVLSKLTGKPLASKKKQYAKEDKRQAEIDYLRSLGGEWAVANKDDLPRARKQGVFKRRDEAAKAASKKKPLVQQFDSDDSDDDENVVGSSSSAPLPKRRKVESEESDDSDANMQSNNDE